MQMGLEQEEIGNKCCGTCDWYAEFEGVCCNGLSESRGGFRDSDYVCECWERK